MGSFPDGGDGPRSGGRAPLEPGDQRLDEQGEGGRGGQRASGRWKTWWATRPDSSRIT